MAWAGIREAGQTPGKSPSLGTMGRSGSRLGPTATWWGHDPGVSRPHPELGSWLWESCPIPVVLVWEVGIHQVFRCLLAIVCAVCWEHPPTHSLNLSEASPALRISTGEWLQCPATGPGAKSKFFPVSPLAL